MRKGGRIGSSRYGLGELGKFLVIRCKLAMGFGVGPRGWGINGGRIRGG